MECGNVENGTLDLPIRADGTPKRRYDNGGWIDVKKQKKEWSEGKGRTPPSTSSPNNAKGQDAERNTTVDYVNAHALSSSQPTPEQRDLHEGCEEENAVRNNQLYTPPEGSPDRRPVRWSLGDANEGVLFAKLTKNDHKITNTIISFPQLRDAVAEVCRMGGSVLPTWAKGGIMLFPYDPTDPQFENVEMESEHVVLAYKDLQALGRAILEIPVESRPGIMFEEVQDLTDALLPSDSEQEEPSPRAHQGGDSSAVCTLLTHESEAKKGEKKVCMACGSFGIMDRCAACNGVTSGDSIC